ncbi:MAG: hypothetical protein HDT21_11300 [Ruminococcus sp.]|nr:hypothetical protein [Ruminococcus sp.]MDE6599725.1 hypothetical protein [Oscillospiraceae bacterium]
MSNHPYITTNIICAIVTVIFCVCEPLRQIPGVILVIILLLGFRFIVFPYIIIINLLSLIAVSKDKIVLGIVLSLFGGSVGSFIAAQASDKKSTVINIIFNISVWFVICVIVGGIIYIENDFRLVGI